jgi:hypothetical protein
LVERPARGNETFSFSSSFSSSKIAWRSEDEDDDEDEKQNTFIPGKTENEGILRILSKTVRQAGLILLFDGEVDRLVEGYWLRVEGSALLRFQLSTLNFQLSTVSTRRVQPNRYPDSGLKPFPAFPPPQSGAVAYGNM